MINLQPVVYGLGPRYRKLDVGYHWKMATGEELPEDSILQNFVKYHKMVADFDAREAAGVAPAMPYINEIKALSSFEDYTSKLAAYELAGKPNLMPFSVSPDFMNAQLNVLWGSALSLILPDTTYYEEGNEKGPELLAIWRQMMEKLLPKLISQRQKSRISWIRSLKLMQNWPNMSYQTKKDPSTTNSTILMSGQIQGLGPRIATRCLLY